MVKSVFSIALAVMLLTHAALAEPLGESTKQARQRFDEGVEAVDAGDYERARVAFEQAYLLKPVPEVLKNLGLAEIDSGHPVQGARHLAQWRRRFGPEHPSDENDAVQRILEKAEAQLTRLKIIVRSEAAKATIVVDQQSVDPDAAQDVWHVLPGKHEIVAKVGDDSQAKTVDGAAGELTVVEFDFRQPNAQGRISPASTSEPESALKQQSMSSKRGAAIVGASTTTVALGIATIFTLRARAADNEAERLQAELGYSSRYPCARTDDTMVCEELRAENRRRDSAADVAKVSWIAAGVLGAGTLAIYLLWPDTETTGGTHIIPAASPRYGGVVVQGAF